jgi:hypothetical protein
MDRDRVRGYLAAQAAMPAFFLGFQGSGQASCSITMVLNDYAVITYRLYSYTVTVTHSTATL